MDKATIKQLAPLIGTKVDAFSSAGWAQMRCPLAPWTHDHGKDSSPSAAIEVKEGGVSRFVCFACENHDLLTLLRRLKELGAQAPKYQLGEALKLVMAEDESDLVLRIRDFDEPAAAVVEDDGNNDAVFNESWLFTFPRAWAVKESRDYLKGRQVDEATADALDLRYNGKHGGVAFPIRNFEGVFSGLRTRRFHPGEDEPAYHMHKNHHGHYNRRVWYGEHTVDFSRPVLMVESVFDFAACWPFYRNVIAPLTVGVSEAKVKRMSGAYDIVTLFDRGKGGDKARRLIRKYLPDAVIVDLLPGGKHYLHPDRDAKDPGEMQQDVLKALLSQHLSLETGK